MSTTDNDAVVTREMAVLDTAAAMHYTTMYSVARKYNPRKNDEVTEKCAKN